jgi:hypothetical protein
VLGLISSKTAALEPIDLLKRRAGEATKYIDAERHEGRVGSDR